MNNLEQNPINRCIENRTNCIIETATNPSNKLHQQSRAASDQTAASKLRQIHRKTCISNRELIPTKSMHSNRNKQQPKTCLSHRESKLVKPAKLASRIWRQIWSSGCIEAATNPANGLRQPIGSRIRSSCCLERHVSGVTRGAPPCRWAEGQRSDAGARPRQGSTRYRAPCASPLPASRG